jgi:hypothetical protein
MNHDDPEVEKNPFLICCTLNFLRVETEERFAAIQKINNNSIRCQVHILLCDFHNRGIIESQVYLAQNMSFPTT